MAVLGKPQKIGKYDVVEVLGEGGMGSVYKAVNQRIGKVVAIKVMKGGFAEDPDLLRRFEHEARMVCGLQHPNIVTVFDFGEENGAPYLVMEYLAGTPLDKIIAQRQNLPIIQKLEIILGVLRALEYAHEHEVIHRDIKPANVHVLKDGGVKLLDFGIAREGNLGQTKTGQVMGTMFYMPPEQMEAQPVDRRGDIFSTGIMLFELLTYTLPFEARDQTSIIVQRLRGAPPPPLSKYFENYPLEMDDIISKAMARDREERYARAEDFAFDLARIQERLKRDMAGHKVNQARELIAKSDLQKAKDLLSEVIRIDTQNATAKQMLYEVQQLLQSQQRVERVHQLRSQAEDALSAKKLDQASDLVEQAIRYDKTDVDLLELREQIQEAKNRAQQVKKLLNFAIVAQQSEQFDVAQKAISDALSIDNSDTDAKVMQAALIRQKGEHEKKSRVQQLLQVARREIAARQYDAARENVDKAKATDPAHPEIPGLEKMLATALEQEKRKAELQQVCSEIEHRLMENKLAAARDLAASAIRKFPGDERLVRLKAAADEAYEQQERRTYIEQHILSASRLVDEGQAIDALKLLQETERLFPGDRRLMEYLAVVREAAARETADRDKKGFLIRAGAAIRRKSFQEAIDTLEQGLVQFPADIEIRELLDTARLEDERLIQQQRIKDATREANDLLSSRRHTDAIRLLERTSAQVSDPELLRLLEYARKEAANYRSGLQDASQQATQLLDSGKANDALAFLEKQAQTYSSSIEFQKLFEQARTQVGEREQTRQRMLRTVNDARAALNAGDPSKAENILQSAVAETPTAPEVKVLSDEIIRARQALEQQRLASEKQATAPLSGQKTRIFEPKAGEVRAATSISPEVEPVAARPVVYPAADTAVPSLATNVFSTSPPSEVQQPLPAAGSAPVEIESPKDTRKEKKSKKKTKAVEVEAESVALAPSPILPPIAEPPIVEPPVAPVPTPPSSNKRFLLIAIAALVLVVGAVVAYKFLSTGTQTTVQKSTNEAYVTVTVTADGKPVSGVEVSIDGKSIGSSAADGTVQAKVDPGDRNLAVTAKDYQPWTRTVPVSQGERKPVEVSLVRPQVEQGTLVVQASDVGAEVFVDGQSQGITDRNRKLTVKVNPGLHQVQLKKSGYLDSAEISVPAVAKKSVSTPQFKALVEIPEKTKLLIDVTPKDAVVRVDGKVADNPAKGVRVVSGNHTVEASKEGYLTQSKSVTVAKDQELRVPSITLPKAPLPVVGPFTANPPTIKRGEPAILTWKTQNATEAAIDNGVGPVQAPDGSKEVRPAVTTTYVLTAKGAGVSVSKNVTVNVIIPPSPKIDEFAAVDSSIMKGKTTKLKWTVQNADQITIEPEIGAVQSPHGDREVHPADTTTYTLTAKGAGVAVTSTAKVTVIIPGKPVIIEFKAADPSVPKGQATKLHWNVKDAEEISIDQGIGKVQVPSGERPINPEKTTTYTLTAKGLGGETLKETVTVTVTAEAPSVKDLPAIHTVLNSFAEAVKNHDTKTLQDLWPHIPKQYLDAYTNKLAQLVIEEKCADDSAKFTSDGAELTCHETITPVVSGKPQAAFPPNTVVIRFKRLGGEVWKIESKNLVK
jgi:serine/threonine-protein kinase